MYAVALPGAVGAPVAARAGGLTPARRSGRPPKRARQRRVGSRRRVPRAGRSHWQGARRPGWGSPGSLQRRIARPRGAGGAGAPPPPPLPPVQSGHVSSIPPY